MRFVHSNLVPESAPSSECAWAARFPVAGAVGLGRWGGLARVLEDGGCMDKA